MAKVSKPEDASPAIPILPPAGIGASVFETDFKVWSDEEFFVLKEAYNAIPLSEPNFWSVVAEFVNNWRKEFYETYKNNVKEAAVPPKVKGKRSRGRKSTVDREDKPIAPLMLRSADHCQSRWFKVFFN